MVLGLPSDGTFRDSGFGVVARAASAVGSFFECDGLSRVAGAGQSGVLELGAVDPSIGHLGLGQKSPAHIGAGQAGAREICAFSIGGPASPCRLALGVHNPGLEHASLNRASLKSAPATFAPDMSGLRNCAP